ncbi:MAG: hypothetical protein WCL50_08905, partial [Spirochaetota bacterium]
SARGGFSGGGFRSAPSFRSVAPSRSFAQPRTLAPPRQAPAQSTTPKRAFTWGSRQAPVGAAASQPRLAPSAAAAGATGAAASRSLYDTARSKGTIYSSQKEASAAFRQSYSSAYSSTFATQPSSRPNWIPATTSVGGRAYPLAWSPALGGYGYFDSLLGRWILYDALSDAAMAASLMGNHGYWWGPPPVYVSHSGSFVVFALFLFALICLLCAVAVVIRVYSARAESSRAESARRRDRGD